jgi:hypothetical protein
MAFTANGGTATRFSAGARLAATVRAVTDGFQRHATLYVLALGTYGLGLAESIWLGVPLSFGLVELVSGTTFVFLFLMIGLWLAGDLARLWWTGYAGSPAAALKHRLFDDILAPGRIANTIHAFVINGVFFVGFLTIKKNIPLVQPFSWDAPFMELDRILHFGTLPHEWLMPLLAWAPVTFAMNVIYNLWFVVLTGFFFWQAFRKQDTALRQRYLIAYLSTWFLGTCVLGTLFSSAGPCFYGFLGEGPDPYAGLLAQLKAANEAYPIWAVPTQELLWQSYKDGFGSVEGVSAMPSMHVGTTILFILCAREARIRWLETAAWIFAALIFLGSILLAWHYAVDGYAGALVALACWKLSGWWVKRTTSLDEANA